MNHRLLSGFAILLAASLAQAISAAAEEAEAVAEPESRFSGIIQADFSNAYFFRGILQERDGLIAEPWGELYYSLYQSDEGLIRDVSIGGGIWASFHTEETLHENEPESLYEVDLYPVVSVEFPHGLSLTTIYYYYTSPNDAFAHTQELNLKFAWDDSETLGRFALQPWINLALETHGTAFGPNRGEGFQMGIEPTLYEIPIENYPVTLTAPIELGLALDDYYEEDDGHETTFGYVSYGISASVPLAFMPEAAGAWTFTLTGKGISLSDTLAEANLGKHTSPVGVASLGVEF